MFVRTSFEYTIVVCCYLIYSDNCLIGGRDAIVPLVGSGMNHMVPQNHRRTGENFLIAQS